MWVPHQWQAAADDDDKDEDKISCSTQHSTILFMLLLSCHCCRAGGRLCEYRRSQYVKYYSLLVYTYAGAVECRTVDGRRDSCSDKGLRLMIIILILSFGVAVYLITAEETRIATGRLCQSFLKNTRNCLQ